MQLQVYQQIPLDDINYGHKPTLHFTNFKSK
jgi:hypothetical protein